MVCGQVGIVQTRAELGCQGPPKIGNPDALSQPALHFGKEGRQKAFGILDLLFFKDP